jgi:23S rRNA pseudouridine1911/1915/1917 synthase
MPLSFVVEADQRHQRLDKLLARLIPEASRATIQRWIVQQRVRVNGEIRRASEWVQLGDVIEVEPGPPPPSRAEPDASVDVNVIHEDDELIVVNKPAGLVIHPGRGHLTGTLVNGLLARGDFSPDAADPRDLQGLLRPGIVHRIDKDTSGVLVVAKTGRAREHLKSQFAAHSLERVYRAITVGCPPAGRIDTLHARHQRARLKFTSRTERGRRAITHVLVLERLVGGAAAVVECRLETGRTHQIRVHLAEQANTPILADALYGRTATQPRVQEVAGSLGRQALHAAVLGFVHPTSSKPLRFEAEMPSDMQAALDKLRA